MRQLNYELLIKKICDWLKEFIHSAHSKGIVIGMSGGIDSAVTAALSTKALGKENVLGIGMPCESIPQDLMDAKLVAGKLDITFRTIDLTSVYSTFLTALPSDITFEKMTLANIKPRLRMTTLHSLAHSHGYLVGGTGNRTEILIGYFTKYGDIGILNEFLH